MGCVDSNKHKDTRHCEAYKTQHFRTMKIILMLYHWLPIVELSTVQYGLAPQRIEE